MIVILYLLFTIEQICVVTFTESLGIFCVANCLNRFDATLKIIVPLLGRTNGWFTVRNQEP